MQQLEQAAESPAPSGRAREKKGRGAKKNGKQGGPLRISDLECHAEGDSALFTDGSTELAETEGFNDAASQGTEASLAASPPPKVRCHAADSDESASTRASSEEPPDELSAQEAKKVRRLMQQMGWRPEAAAGALDGAEVAAWREQHPSYRQAIREERQRLQSQFQQWARDATRGGPALDSLRPPH